MPKHIFSNFNFVITYKEFLLRLKLQRRVRCVLSNTHLYLQVLPRENYYTKHNARFCVSVLEFKIKNSRKKVEKSCRQTTTALSVHVSTCTLHYNCKNQLSWYLKPPKSCSYAGAPFLFFLITGCFSYYGR